jgi:N-acetylmuramoyl-L-alanine amidase
MARFLAASENNSDLAGTVGGVNLDDKDEVLAGVLVDLSMTATLANSLDVGARVLRELGKVTRLHNRQVEQAGFLVLKSPDVPSILVETGFISNPREAQQLATQAHRERVARAVFAGVRSYFSASAPPVELATATRGGPEASADHINPQPSTPKMASRSAMREAESGARVAPQAPHLVVVGDTLEKIARRYGVTQQAILAANKMTSTTVKTGQRLKIPVN